MSLRPSSPIPLYHQLAEQLREGIESGQYPVGAQLPSVRELAQQEGISYMTARQAIGELVKQGLLEIRKGLGAYVARSKITYDSLRLSSFTEDMRKLERPSYSELLALEITEPTPSIARHLQIEVRERVIRIERLRYGGNEALVLDCSYLVAALCPGLEQSRLETTSLYELLEGKYGLKLVHSAEWLEATGANAYEAELLQIPERTPMILVRGVTYLTDERPIEYYKSLFRGDRFRFKIDTSRRPQEA